MTNLKKIIEEWKEMRVKIGDAFTSNAILKDYKYDDVNMMVQALEEAVEAMKSYTNSVTSEWCYATPWASEWFEKWGMD